MFPWPLGSMDSGTKPTQCPTTLQVISLGCHSIECFWKAGHPSDPCNVVEMSGQWHGGSSTNYVSETTRKSIDCNDMEELRRWQFWVASPAGPKLRNCRDVVGYSISQQVLSLRAKCGILSSKCLEFEKMMAADELGMQLVNHPRPRQSPGDSFEKARPAE